jgi:hypothetical protein
MLSDTDNTRAQRMLADIVTSGGAGMIGLFSPETRQVYIATVDGGEIRGWLLVPAADAYIAERMRDVLAGSLLAAMSRIATESEALAAGAIAKAMRPG